VQLEPQGPEPLGERVPQPPGLFLGVAVDNNVVRLLSRNWTSRLWFGSLFV